MHMQCEYYPYRDRGNRQAARRKRPVHHQSSSGMPYRLADDDDDDNNLVVVVRSLRRLALRIFANFSSVRSLISETHKR